MIPTLETPRLLLRAHERTDYDACARMWGDARVTRYIGGRPSTPRETWMRLVTYRGLWPLLGYGYWAVQERATGAYVGDVGLADFRREIEPPIAGVPELGWVLAPDVHGRGYATEAVGAALAWADERLDAPRTVCIVAPENAPSIAVARKCGFSDPVSTTFAGEPTLLFERPKPAP